eukprot:1531931-Karenia_brevis.AAC.1
MYVRPWKTPEGAQTGKGSQEADAKDEDKEIKHKEKSKDLEEEEPQPAPPKGDEGKNAKRRRKQRSKEQTGDAPPSRVVESSEKMHQAPLVDEVEEAAIKLGIDESDIPVAAPMQKQASLRELEVLDTKQATFSTFENNKSLSQIDASETNKLLVVYGLAEGWKDHHRDKILGNLIGSIAERLGDVVDIQH